MLSSTGRAVQRHPCHTDCEPALSPAAVLQAWLQQTADGDDLQPRLLRCADGSLVPLPVARWSAAVDEVDLALLARAGGPVLDLGCGPGRLSAELHRQGTPVLGLELLDDVPVRARAAGAPLLIGDLFGPVPDEGGWASVLLADGNVGIGGDPVRLLERARELLAPNGQVLVELHPAPLPVGQVRLEGLGVVSSWFDWTLLTVASLPPVASTAGLFIRDTWEQQGRAFAALEHEA